MSFVILNRGRSISGSSSTTDSYNFFTDFSGFSGNLLSPVLSTDTHGGVWPEDNVFSWNPNGSSSTGMAYITTSVHEPEQTHSLAFDFPASPPGGDSNIEQNVSFGRAIGGFGQTIRMEFYLYVTPNFYLREPGEPTKFFQFWSNEYGNASGACTVVGITLRADTGGGCILQPFVTNNLYGPGATSIWQAGPQSTPNGSQFISPLGYSSPGLVVPGQWNRIRIAVKFSSSWDAMDGYFKVYVGDLPHMLAGPDSICNPAGPSGPPPVLRGGYLMGYSNSGYDEATSYYWSRLRITDADLGWGF